VTKGPGARRRSVLPWLAAPRGDVDWCLEYHGICFWVLEEFGIVPEWIGMPKQARVPFFEDLLSNFTL
jgi:hypothetical protein